MPGVLALGGLTPGVVTPAAPVVGACTVPPLTGGVVTVAPPAPTEREGAAGVLTAGGAIGGVVTAPPPTDGGVTVAPPTGGVVTVCAPAAPAAVTRARVRRVRFMKVPPLSFGKSGLNAEARQALRGEISWFRHIAQRVSVWPTNLRKRQCTTTSSWAAARPARSWLIGFRQRAPTRCCCARRARTRRRARSPRRSPTAIPAPPTSTRASTGPISRSTPRSSRTTIRRRTGRRCASTSRRACWAAARRSTARWPIAARPPTTMNG